MTIRYPFAALAFLAIPTVAHADLGCTDNFLSGSAQYVIDAESGAPMVTLPYAAEGYGGVGPSYDIDLGGGGTYGQPVYPPLPPEPPLPPVEPPVEPGFTDDLALAPNDAGATRLTFPGDGTGRLTGPNTDFTFTGVDPTGLFVDGDLIARGGSGVVNGRRTTAVVDASGIALRLGSGFNVTRTRGVNATFADGTVLNTVVQLVPVAPPSGSFAGDLMLQPNALGATRIVFDASGTARLTGPGIDVTFTGVDASALAFDGPVVASGGQGTIGGVMVTAVPIQGGFRNAVLTLGSGFNPTGTRALRAAFSNGAMLETTVLRN